MIMAKENLYMKPDHQEKIKMIFEKMHNFIYEHPVYGKYYSGYGTGVFTCENYFDPLALCLAGICDAPYAENLVKINISLQDETGHIPRHSADLIEDPNKLNTEGWSSKSLFVNGKMVNPWVWYETEEHAQPFLYQIATFATRMRGGDVSWIDNKIYLGLKKYIDCWLNVWDKSKNGLCVVASASHAISDNSFPRAGTWRSYFSETPDFNAFIYMELKCAAKIAAALKKNDDVKYFEEQAALKKQRINEILWDEQAGCYFCRDVRTGALIPVDAINNYYPMWAGIASSKQVERMVKEHLFNPKKLYSPFPFASYAMDEPTYTQVHKNDTILLDDYVMLPEGHCNWRGGIWAHPHYMLTQSLKRYGYVKEAKDVADKIFDLTIDNPYVCEWHNAETGEMYGAQIGGGVQILQRLMPVLLEVGFDIDYVEDALDKALGIEKVHSALGLL